MTRDNVPEGSRFFDHPDVFERYRRRRDRALSPNELIEKPIIDELVGEVRGADILDLGCGDGRYALELLASGCSSYLGIDGSARMIALAKTVLGESQAQVVHADIADWTCPEARFDLVVSRLALHYVADLESVLCQAHSALRADGRLIVSVEHPVMTSSDEANTRGPRTSSEPRTSWIVDRYFESGPRTVSWLQSEVRLYHRAVEDYFGAFRLAGFRVEELREARPRRERFDDESEFRRRSRVPLMLFLSGRRLRDTPASGPSPSS